MYVIFYVSNTLTYKYSFFSMPLSIFFIFKENYKDFQLSNVISYIRSGIEAIIEDQVTSRFEAEELKNWNLLIRTHSGYEFISWKLTIIWMCGFVFRYFFLFPLRVTICFIGVSRNFLNNFV